MYQQRREGVILLRRKGMNLWGLIAICAGVIIILSLVLPKSFWWFALAAALIGGGIWLIRCC